LTYLQRIITELILASHKFKVRLVTGHQYINKN